MLWAARLLARIVGSVWELASRLRRRSAPDPADELRRKLAEAREREIAVEARSPGEAIAAPPGPSPETASASEGSGPEPPPIETAGLRNEAHTRARAPAEEMHGTSGSE
jgi:hypothetical protein